MREIKFRIWDKENNSYVPLDSLIFDIGEEPETYGQIRDIKICTGEFWSLLPEHVIIEQFTGLKDKNGKEIYEGDIIKYDDGEDWETGREEVKFINGAFNCVCFHPDNKEFIDENRIIEVIGNIHENPELLTSK